MTLLWVEDDVAERALWLRGRHFVHNPSTRAAKFTLVGIPALFGIAGLIRQLKRRGQEVEW